MRCCFRRTYATRRWPTTSCRDRWSPWRSDGGFPHCPPAIHVPARVRSRNHRRHRATCLAISTICVTRRPRRMGGHLRRRRPRVLVCAVTTRRHPRRPGFAAVCSTSLAPGWVEYTFLERGSDERQWCSPGADLPVCSVMRSKYGTFPNTTRASMISTSSRRQVSTAASRSSERCIELLESNRCWRAVLPGEPQLGPRGLYPTTELQGKRTLMCGDDECARLLRRLPRRHRSRGMTGAPTAVIVEILERLSTAGVIEAVD